MLNKSENAASSTLFAVALSVTSGLGSSNFPWEKINEYSPESLFDMISGSSRATQHFIASLFPKLAIDAAHAIIEKADSGGIALTHYWDDLYPPVLREIPRPPLVLYYIGDLSADKTAAVVGTRKPSEYSRSAAKTITERLAVNGFAVISGMAMGIDAAAHQAAIEAGGRTIGVLANGIGVLYPSANAHLYDLIAEHPSSALISEYPPGVHAGRWTFVRRNRIISGLCRGVIVVQAGAKSGTLITARYAAEQGRDVFVCPGNAFDESYIGSHKLIDDGARILYNLDDLIEALNEAALPVQLNLFDSNKLNISDADNNRTPVDFKILDYLAVKNKPVDVDTIIRECGIPVDEFQESVVTLELEGRVMRKGNILFAG